MIAPVEGSGDWPAWMTRVASACACGFKVFIRSVVCISQGRSYTAKVGTLVQSHHKSCRRPARDFEPAHPLCDEIDGQLESPVSRGMRDADVHGPAFPGSDRIGRNGKPGIILFDQAPVGSVQMHADIDRTDPAERWQPSGWSRVGDRSAHESPRVTDLGRKIDGSPQAGPRTAIHAGQGITLVKEKR